MGQNSSIPLTNTYSGTPTLGSDPWGSLSQLSSSSCTTCIPMGVFVVVQLLSHVWLFENSWTIAHQAPLSMVFSRQENWSVLPFPSPGNLPDPEIEPESPALQADSLPSEPQGKPKIEYNFHYFFTFYIIFLLFYISSKDFSKLKKKLRRMIFERYTTHILLFCLEFVFKKQNSDCLLNIYHNMSIQTTVHILSI